MTSKPNSVPVLETRRLILRGHRVEDFAECAAMWREPQVFQYLGGRPFSDEETWARLLRYAGHWALMGFGYWAVEEKASGLFAGELGFADFKRDIDPSLGGRPEAGWVFASRAHGRGYATEALETALEWARRHFGPVETVCLIHPENYASLRVAEKCRFSVFGRSTYKGFATVMLARQLLEE